MATQTKQQTSYDRVPYPSHAFPQTHPDRLAAVAKLFGLEPAGVERCRVLEIGCASGGNLIPMADSLPESTFVGIDLSTRQIEAGQATVSALGLDNLDLMPKDILEVDESLGRFDYIVCHGIFSWVPREVQNKILWIAQTLLQPRGVAYISYNTYPGWHMRETIRDMMCYHSTAYSEPETRVRESRALLDFLAKAVSAESGAYGMFLQSELQLLQQSTDSYLFHEHLEEVNDPLYFHQFIGRAADFNLAYLGEASASSMWSGNLPTEVRDTIVAASSDAVQLEQYMDFVNNRTFRQTLLCHDSVQPNRRLTGTQILEFFLASPLKPVTGEVVLHSQASETFVVPGSRHTVTTSDPLIKAAFFTLAERWPTCIHFEELFKEACALLKAHPIQDAGSIEAATDTLAGILMRCFAGGCLEIYTSPSRFKLEPTGKPAASRLARRQAEVGQVVTTCRHETNTLTGLSRQIVPLLDGTRDKDELVDALEEMIDEGTLVLQSEEAKTSDSVESRRRLLETTLDRQLAQLGRAALLIA